MASTGAERQRRYRRHQAGDHGFCIPGHCSEVTPELSDDVTAGVTHEKPRLGPAGSELWISVLAEEDPGPMGRALLLEACRIVDRLDRLDDQLDGGDWLEIETEEGGQLTVVVDKALSEARQQAVALKGVVAEIRQVSRGSKAAGPSQSSSKGAEGIADLSARIAARRQTSG